METRVDVENISIDGRSVSIEEIIADVDAAIKKGYRGQFAFCPETVLGLCNKIKELTEIIKTIMQNEGILL